MEKLRKKLKKGMYFSLDAVIALSFILIIVVVAFPLMKNKDLSSKENYDLIKVLSTIKIDEINSSYVKELINDGSITNLNNTLLEQIGEFYVKNVTRAKVFAQEIIGQMDTKKNIGLWYGNKLIAQKNSSPYEEAEDIYVSKQVISGIQEGNSSITGFSARVTLTNKLQNKFFYFGGYIGDGNITLNMSYNGTIKRSEIELAVNNNFSIYINGNLSGTFSQSPSQTTPVRYDLPIANFRSGDNIIKVITLNNNSGPLFIAGGFIKLTYEEEQVYYDAPKLTHFPGIQGIINLYDGIDVPGQLKSMEIFLHYNSTQPIFLTIGNTTLLSNTSQNENYTLLLNSTLVAILNYSLLSNTSTPLRLGLQEIFLNGSGGNADVILITDTSGSMDWRMNADSTGTARSCSSSSLYLSSTKRISLAKCLDQDFISTILNVKGNRVGLVAFSSSADNFVNLSTNLTLINSTISAYSASGATCVACAINRAYQILQYQSNNSRKKFIVTMTDGVANVRATKNCMSISSEDAIQEQKIQSGGENGLLISRNQTYSLWSSINSPTANQINGMKFFNNTFGFAVGNSGTILRWNGSAWYNLSTPLSADLTSLDIINNTFAIAQSETGNIIKWNGTRWNQLVNLSSNPNLYAISIYNRTLMFSTGTLSGNGKIYKSINGGASWTEDFSLSTDLYGVDLVNNTLAYAVGEAGAIIRWNGSVWTSVSSPTNHLLTSVNFENSSLGYAVGGDDGNAIVLKFLSGSWSQNELDASADTLRAIKSFNNSAYAIGDEGSILELTNSSWSMNFNFPLAFKGNETTGLTCSSDEDSCSEISSYPAVNANYSSCRAKDDLGAKIYSIGFGPVSTCNFAIQTLQGIARCGNGSYYSGSNSTELQNVYNSIANDIIHIAYNEQMSQITGNVSSTLFPDSYIKLDYTAIPRPYGLVLTSERSFNNETGVFFHLPKNITVLEAQVVSYSGPRWTSTVILNGVTVYNLTKFGRKFSELGDPYSITLPSSILQENNQIYLKTGISSTNQTNGSSYNKIIYSTLSNVSAYSPILIRAEGCIWSIQFEDASNVSVSAPGSYIGANRCYYNGTTVIYDQNDAFQEATVRLFRLLDYDNNGKIDAIFSPDELEISLTQITGIPFTWSTEVQAKQWV